MSHHKYKEAEKRVKEIDIDYQKQYLNSPRECDKKTINFIKKNLNPKKNNIADLGSGNGNFLFHLKKKVPFQNYFGFEYSRQMLNKCKSQEYLKEINFNEINIIKKPIRPNMDVIVSTAVTYQFKESEFIKCMKNIYKSLKKNGTYIGYELVNEFSQELTIIEKTDLYKTGIPLHIRSKNYLKKILIKIGFKEINFNFFNIRIDLESKKNISKMSNEYVEHLKTYTVTDMKKKRHMFRGSIFEPWCHIICKK